MRQISKLLWISLILGFPAGALGQSGSVMPGRNAGTAASQRLDRIEKIARSIPSEPPRDEFQALNELNRLDDNLGRIWTMQAEQRMALQAIQQVSVVKDELRVKTQLAT